MSTGRKALGQPMLELESGGEGLVWERKMVEEGSTELNKETKGALQINMVCIQKLAMFMILMETM